LHALTVVLLVVAAALYAAGTVALWRKAGVGRGITPGNVILFGLSLGILAAGLLTPLHHMAERALWAHMVQHELLVVAAAPLIVLGRPLEAFAWALPAGLVRLPGLLSSLLLAWALHALALWIWHMPVPFTAALHSEALHFAQHASFFATAVLFWWAVLRPGRAKLGALVALFTTMLHTGALGALMALAPAAWYAGYALEDQQMAGLVMWIPGGAAYLLAALALAARWLAPDGPNGAYVLKDYAR
jgi:putative membrane protein